MISWYTTWTSSKENFVPTWKKGSLKSSRCSKAEFWNLRAPLATQCFVGFVTDTAEMSECMDGFSKHSPFVMTPGRAYVNKYLELATCFFIGHVHLTYTWKMSLSFACIDINKVLYLFWLSLESLSSELSSAEDYLRKCREKKNRPMSLLGQSSKSAVSLVN